MPTARVSLGAGAVNGIVYAIGGLVVPHPEAVSTVEAYDTKADTWSARAPLLIHRFGMAVGVVGGGIYIAGGATGANTSREVESYDPVTNAWTTRAPMATAHFLPAYGVIDGVFYVVGGDATGQVVEAYDPKTGTWVAKPPVPTPRYQGAAGGVLGGRLYVVGGLGASSELEAYDPKINTWTSEAPIPTPRVGAAAAAIDGLLYVVGGRSPSGAVLNTVESYDPKRNSWSTANPMPVARAALAVCAADDTLFGLGGQDSAGSFLNLNEAFSPFLFVGIDIKPGDATNTINLRSAGTVAVAILGSATFDPMTVDPATVTLAGAPVATRAQGTAMTAQGDLNHDGYLDLLLHFRTQDLQLTLASTEAVLYGETFSGERLRGSDSVRIVPPGAGRSVGQASKELRGRGAFTRVQGPPVAR